jgi:hypothetical protein
MKPDHVRTYERMPKIMEAFLCPQLLPRVNALLGEVHGLGAGTPEQWKRLTGIGIALLSLTTIIWARVAEVTDEFTDKRHRVNNSLDPNSIRITQADKDP